MGFLFLLLRCSLTSRQQSSANRMQYKIKSRGIFIFIAEVQSNFASAKLQ